jgi:hypothetical protein
VALPPRAVTPLHLATWPHHIPSLSQRHRPRLRHERNAASSTPYFWLVFRLFPFAWGIALKLGTAKAARCSLAAARAHPRRASRCSDRGIDGAQQPELPPNGAPIVGGRKRLDGGRTPPFAVCSRRRCEYICSCTAHRECQRARVSIAMPQSPPPPCPRRFLTRAQR